MICAKSPSSLKEGFDEANRESVKIKAYCGNQLFEQIGSSFLSFICLLECRFYERRFPVSSWEDRRGNTPVMNAGWFRAEGWPENTEYREPPRLPYIGGRMKSTDHGKLVSFVKFLVQKVPRNATSLRWLSCQRVASSSVCPRQSDTSRCDAGWERLVDVPKGSGRGFREYLARSSLRWSFATGLPRTIQIRIWLSSDETILEYRRTAKR